jgi:hypothetical protein
LETIQLPQIIADIIKQKDEQIQTLSNDLKISRSNTQRHFMSEEIKDLAVALAQCQGEITIAFLNKSNPYFKSSYADMASIVGASRPYLTKHGLSVVQNIVTHDDGQTVLHTILLHGSGQYIESRMRVLPTKNDIQSMSSYITYLKRIAYTSLIGVVTGDEDDDGEAAVADTRDLLAKGVALNHKYNPKEDAPEPITKEQLEELHYELSEYPDIAEQVLDGLKIQNLADMPKSKYMISIRRVREIKQSRNKK